MCNRLQSDITIFTQNDNLINNIKPNGIILVNSSLSPSAFWQSLSAEIQEKVIQKNVAIYIVNLDQLKSSYQLKKHTITALEACFLTFKYNKIYPFLNKIKKLIHPVDTSTQTHKKSLEKDMDFAETLLGKLLTNQGNNIAVSELPVDGTFPTDTSKFNQPHKIDLIPKWDADLCTQCGACSMACTHSALIITVVDVS
ncbi:MAG: 4Fe-4S binding protein [Flavobacteriaceae bacterium]